MALKAYPLNDTDYTAEDAQLYTATRTSGVYADNHFNISVTGTDNNVTIKPGMGWMKLGIFQGIAVANTEDVTINAGVPDSILPRIDAIVYAYDANANKPEIIIKQGEKGTTPTPPAVVRDDFRHELHLYHIRRRPGATAITPGDITDLRMDANYCGLMADSVTYVDMSAINAQVREFISDWENQIANVTDGKMIEAPESPGCYYRMNRGVKEWLNPPMMEDVEYPTTKRQDGKRVYTKLLKARSMAGSVSLPDIERIVSVFAVAERDWNGEKLMFQLPVDFLPEDSPTIQKMQIYYQGNTIVFQSVVAKGMYNLYITVEYTKPGDEVAYTNVTADGDTVNVETNGNVSTQGDNLNVEMFTTVSADGGTYIRRLTINGVAYDLAVGQAGSGAPGTAYPGIPGQFYTDLDSGEVYVCMGGSADVGVYIWRTIIPSMLPTSGVILKHKTGIKSALITANQAAIFVSNINKDAVIRGVANPVNANDVANKQYVDSKIGSGQNVDLIYSMKSNSPFVNGEQKVENVPLAVYGFIRTDGTISTSENCKMTDYVPITSNMVSIYAQASVASNGYAVAFFDADKNLLPGISILGNIGGAVKPPQVVDITLDATYADAKYFTVAYYDATKVYQHYSCTVTYRTYDGEMDYGLNVLIFGDSITDAANITIDENDRTTAYSTRTISYENANGETVTYNKWPNLISNILDCKDVRNYALNGASYKDKQREVGLERRNASYQIQVALNDLNNPNGVFPSGKFEPDIIIFALGTNDGTPNDTPESALSKIVLNADGYSVDVSATLSALNRVNFCEAVMWAFLTIKRAFPMALAFCVLPIQRANNETNTGTLHDCLLKMANRYGIIPIDGAYHSGIVRDLEVKDGLGTMLKDGLHPNEKGQNLLCRAILTAIRRYYLPFDGMN